MNIQRRRWVMDRRTFLQGAGVAVALPWLEAMGIHATSYSKAGELAASEMPKRAVFTCWGLGMNPFTSTPEKTGLDYQLPESVAPMEAFRKETTFFTRLHAVTGGHQSAHCFLTGVDAHKGKYGISIDQELAALVGSQTRFPTITLSHTRATGFGGDGQHTLSWTTNRTPIVPENRPQAVFDRLFRADSDAEIAANKRRAAEQASVLDAVREQAKRLQGQLGQADRAKLEEYFTSIRDLEAQMATDAAWLAKPKPTVTAVDYAKSQLNWFKSMFDVIALALQTDSTRLVTFNVRSDLGGSNYKDHGEDRGIPWDQHTITHNNGEEEKLRWWTKLDAWQMQEWAFFLERLKGMKEGSKSVLDHTLALWGTTNGGPAAHDRTNLPALLTGGTALGIQHAGHIDGENQVPLGNLMRTMGERLGLKTGEKFYGGAHSGTIKELS
jgi:hypothetical protein